MNYILLLISTILNQTFIIIFFRVKEKCHTFFSQNFVREFIEDFQVFERQNMIEILASSLAVLVFEVPVSVPLSGIELFKQFVAVNLGTLISQRLLENEDKIR
jgi:hypothetical protein